MKVSEFVELAGATLLSKDVPDNEISSGYTCDLLSHVMGKGVEGMAWITVQTHMNVIAVALLHEFSCIIIPEGIDVNQQIVDKAAEESIAVISSEKTAYELIALMIQAGISAAKKQ